MKRKRPIPDDLFGNDLWDRRPFPRFVSKINFSNTDTQAVINSVAWFSRCSQLDQFNLTMPVKQVSSWQEAIESCSNLNWENATLEAKNQLSAFLHDNVRQQYQNWNQLAANHKQETIEPLMQDKVIPYLEQYNLPETVLNCVRWDLLGALMERSYTNTSHHTFFFHELLMVYKAGHFPCGWIGDWPEGILLTF